MKGFKAEELPALVGQNGARVEMTNVDALETVGTPFSGAGMAVDDTVEFPDSIEDAQIARVEVRKDSGRWDYRVAVLKNNKPAWVSIGYFNKLDKDNKPVHAVAEVLAPLHDHKARLAALCGKKITATETVAFQARKFDNDGRLVSGVYDEKSCPKCFFKE